MRKIVKDVCNLIHKNSRLNESIKTQNKVAEWTKGDRKKPMPSLTTNPNARGNGKNFSPCLLFLQNTLAKHVPDMFLQKKGRSVQRGKKIPRCGWTGQCLYWMQSFARCTNAKLQEIKEPCLNKEWNWKTAHDREKDASSPVGESCGYCLSAEEGDWWEALHGIKAVILGDSGGFVFKNSLISCA